MDNQQKNSMYALLYSMVLIDSRVARVEMNQFLNRVEGFLKTLSFREKYSAQSEVTDWFMANYKTILRKINSPEKEAFILEHAKHLKTSEHRQAIFNMMKDIAFADHEYHDSEEALLGTVAEIWDLESFVRPDARLDISQ